MWGWETVNQDICILRGRSASFHMDVCVGTLDKVKSADQAVFMCVRVICPEVCVWVGGEGAGLFMM